MILPDGRSLNREMVGEGMAWWYRAYTPHDAELEWHEAEAKAAKRGLWSQPNPVPPWSWRTGDGVPKTEVVIGNRRSRVYHRPTCRGATTMSEKNRIRLNSAAKAEAGGCRRAGGCR